MARYIEAKCRLCRRIGDKLMLKGERCFSAKCTVERRNFPPGMHGNSKKRRSKVSDHGLQLLEKQKAKYTYGVLERQFRKGFAEALRLPGVTGDHLVVLLERRLDNIIFRLGFADSRNQSRQLVRHGHIRLNGRKTDIPSCLVKAGDIITWHPSSVKGEYYKIMVEKIKDRIIPVWLALDAGQMEGKVLALPTRADIDTKFEPNMIVEFYSR
jgi:small subunit ribosomal protein S4